MQGEEICCARQRGLICKAKGFVLQGKGILFLQGTEKKSDGNVIEKTNENVLRKSSKTWTSETGGARPAVTKNTKSLLLQRTPMG